MERKNRISNGQLEALILTIAIGVGVLSLPNVLANILGNDGWIIIIVGGLVTLPFLYIMYKLNKMFPGEVYFEYGKKIVGTTLFDVFNILYIIFYIFMLAFEVRVFAEVIKAFLLDRTPTEVIIITMLLVSSYIARKDFGAIGRMAIILIFIVGTIMFIFTILALPTMDYTNIFPLFRIGLGDIKNILKGLGYISFSYVGFEIILIAMAYIEKPKDSLRYSIKSIFYITIIYLITFFISLAQLGIYDTKRQVWPMLSIMREIELPGFFIENLDALVMSAWVLAVFGTIGPLMYASGIILKSIFNTKRHNFFILPLIPIVYIISLIPQNLSQVYSQIDIMSKILGTFTLFVCPTMLYIIARLRKGG